MSVERAERAVVRAAIRYAAHRSKPGELVGAVAALLAAWGEDALEELREVRDEIHRAYLVRLSEEIRAETRPLIKCK
jgi:hypothetical protein